MWVVLCFKGIVETHINKVGKKSESQGFQNKLATAGVPLATLSFTAGYFSHDKNTSLHVSKLTPNLTPKQPVHTRFQTMVLLAVIYS